LQIDIQERIRGIQRPERCQEGKDLGLLQVEKGMCTTDGMALDKLGGAEEHPRRKVGCDPSHENKKPLSISGVTWG
jgi:hypothetical protein